MLNQAQWQVERLDEKVTGRVKRTVEKLQTWIERTEQVAEQTAKVQAGELRIPDRLVSMFDPDARPIRKGKLHKPRTLEERGVKRVSLPQRGKLSAKRKTVQKQFWFRRLQKWRAGGEATISVLKRKYGLNRSLFRGRDETKTWVGFGVLAYNLNRLAAIT